MPHEYAEREHAYVDMLRARMRIAVLFAERSFTRQHHDARQARLMEEITALAADIDALAADVRSGKVPEPASLDRLTSELELLRRVRHDNDGDFFAEDARMADEIDSLETCVAAWLQRLN